MQKKHPGIAKLDEIKQLTKHDQLHFLFENNEINSIKILGESSISYKNEYKTRPVNNWSALENTWNQRVNKILLPWYSTHFNFRLPKQCSIDEQKLRHVNIIM